MRRRGPQQWNFNSRISILLNPPLHFVGRAARGHYQSGASYLAAPLLELLTPKTIV